MRYFLRDIWYTAILLVTIDWLGSRRERKTLEALNEAFRNAGLKE